MAKRSDESSISAPRDDRETLLEIARQITGEAQLREDGGAACAEGRKEDCRDAAFNGADISFRESPAGMAICAEGRILRANASFALAFGYPSPDALLAAGGLAAVFPADRRAFDPEVVNGGARRLLNAMTRSRRRIRIPVALHAVAGDDGEAAILLVLHPRAEDGYPHAQAQHAETKTSEAATGTEAPPCTQKNKTRARSEADFLARVSHDIRTPLNSIIGFAQLMRAEQAGPLGNERYRVYAGDIVESGEHALRLIDDLLIISRIEAGCFDLNFVSVDLNELVGERVSAAHAEAQKGRVFLRASLCDALPEVLADRPTLDRIVLTLLTNAVACSQPGGQAIAETRVKASGAIQLRVQDSGGGMTEAEIEQALQPLVQRDTVPHPRFGNGLALPLTRALAKANRAKFRLESEPGRGTRIAITFPARRMVARPG